MLDEKKNTSKFQGSEVIAVRQNACSVQIVTGVDAALVVRFIGRKCDFSKEIVERPPLLSVWVTDILTRSAQPHFLTLWNFVNKIPTKIVFFYILTKPNACRSYSSAIPTLTGKQSVK